LTFVCKRFKTTQLLEPDSKVLGSIDYFYNRMSYRNVLGTCDIFLGWGGVSATPALNEWLSVQVFEFLGIRPGVSRMSKIGHSDMSCEEDGPHSYI
jgi:hypothetical protein